VTPETLAALRAAIEGVDRRIFRLLGERLELAHRIGEVKLDKRLPIRDFRVETQVLERAADLSRGIGLEPALGRELAGVLLRASIKVQEDLREKDHQGTLRRVVIVGGRGKMGSWLSHFLHGQGHRVTVVDSAGPLEGFPHAATIDAAPADTEIFVLSVPPGAAPGLYQRLLVWPGNPLVVDILSVKSPVIGVIRDGAARGRRIASIHPMFGPGVVLLSGRILAVCDCGMPAAAAEARNLFAGTSLTVTEVLLEEHDRYMAIVLGLSHALSISFFHALVLSGITSRTLHRFASTTFAKQVATATEVARENADLYYEIQHLNPHTGDAFELLLRAATGVHAAAGEDDPSAFLTIMNEGRAYLEGE